jgi:hypothetical protein
MGKTYTSGDETLIQKDDGTLVYINTKTGVVEDGITNANQLPSIRHKPAIAASPIVPTTLSGQLDVAKHLGLAEPEKAAPYVSEWTRNGFLKSTGSRPQIYKIAEVDAFKASPVGAKLIAQVNGRTLKLNRSKAF